MTAVRQAGSNWQAKTTGIEGKVVQVAPPEGQGAIPPPPQLVQRELQAVVIGDVMTLGFVVYCCRYLIEKKINLNGHLFKLLFLFHSCIVSKSNTTSNVSKANLNVISFY